MNDTINSAFIYEGKAIIKFVKNNKVYKTIESHNNATPLFFKYILLSITGANVTSEMPQFLMLANTEDPILSYRVPLSKYVDDSDSSSPVARFTGYVPYGAIRSTIDSESGNKSISINKLSIYNRASGDDNITLLATVDLLSNTNTTITPGTTIIVEWNVTIVDANKKEPTEDLIQTKTVSDTISSRTLLKQVKG